MASFLISTMETFQLYPKDFAHFVVFLSCILGITAIERCHSFSVNRILLARLIKLVQKKKKEGSNQQTYSRLIGQHTV